MGKAASDRQRLLRIVFVELVGRCPAIHVAANEIELALQAHRRGVMQRARDQGAVGSSGRFPDGRSRACARPPATRRSVDPAGDVGNRDLGTRGRHRRGGAPATRPLRRGCRDQQSPPITSAAAAVPDVCLRIHGSFMWSRSEAKRGNRRPMLNDANGNAQLSLGGDLRHVGPPLDRSSTQSGRVAPKVAADPRDRVGNGLCLPEVISPTKPRRPHAPR